MLAIAKVYGVIIRVQDPIKSLFYDFIGHRMFWEVVAKHPVRCCKIAVLLADRTLYEEALKHLVGSSAVREKNTTWAGLSYSVRSIIGSKAHELRHQRMKVDVQLLSFTKSMTVVSPRSGHALVAANMLHDPAWTTVNLFRDWMAEHITNLRSYGDPDIDPLASRLCDHTQGCTTMAGFYRLISKGGEAYLPSGKAIEQWSSTDFPLKNGDTVKRILRILKDEAAKLVAPLVRSTLQLPDQSVLEYLTPVVVETKDVPWYTVRNDAVWHAFVRAPATAQWKCCLDD